MKDRLDSGGDVIGRVWRVEEQSWWRDEGDIQSQDRREVKELHTSQTGNTSIVRNTCVDIPYFW